VVTTGAVELSFEGEGDGKFPETMTGSRLAALTASLTLLLLLAAIGSANLRASAAGDPLTAVGGPMVVAVGDIACVPGGTVTTTTCRDADTATLARSYSPAWVFALGDLQYEAGRLRDFRNAYDKTWGQFRAITKPIPGNHEYQTPGATGYFSYFSNQTSAPGYYAFSLGNWRVYALNSNCANISCSREAAWLDADMTANPANCTALLMHAPLYSSSLGTAGTPSVRPFWRIARAHGADLVLAGHAHNYERFRTMDAYGNATPTGLASFVSGAGGRSLTRTPRTRVAGSVVFDNRRAGVLALKLGSVRYGWQYQTIDGGVIDSGIQNCT
jgi:acid phosphatase type 7